MRKSHKRLAALAAGTAAIVAGTGIGYAFWTTTGSGSDHSASTATAGTVALASTFDASTLAPGTSVPVSFTAANSSDTDLSIATPVAVITSDKKYDATHSCADYLSFANSTLTGGVILHGATAQDIGGADLVFANDASVNQNGCLGQTVTITLTSS